MNNFNKTLNILNEKFEYTFSDEQLIKENKQKMVTIEKSSVTKEYRVPSEDGYENGAAYTDDKQEAIAIAKRVFGSDCIIKFRSVFEFCGGKYEKYRPE